MAVPFLAILMGRLWSLRRGPWATAAWAHLGVWSTHPVRCACGRDWWSPLSPAADASPPRPVRGAWRARQLSVAYYPRPLGLPEVNSDRCRGAGLHTRCGSDRSSPNRLGAAADAVVVHHCHHAGRCIYRASPVAGRSTWRRCVGRTVRRHGTPRGGTGRDSGWFPLLPHSSWRASTQRCSCWDAGGELSGATSATVPVVA